jgi:hypothetical protein
VIAEDNLGDIIGNAQRAVLIFDGELTQKNVSQLNSET